MIKLLLTLSIYLVGFGISMIYLVGFGISMIYLVGFGERNDRLCNICKSSDIGDEYHYFCICPVFKSVRLKLLPRDCFVRPSVHKFCELLSSSNKRVQVKVAKFAGVVFKKLNNV